MDNAIKIHDLRHAREFPPELFRRVEADLTDFTAKVAPIIEAVRRDGDRALRRFAADFDKVTQQDYDLLASEREFESAFTRVPPDIVSAIEFAIENIRRVHEAQKPEELWLKEVRPGVWAGDRTVPIDTVACYVPRGKGSFPSVVNMTAVPAVVAGVRRPIILTPALPDGSVDPATLVAAKLAGVREVFKCGGAQAVAAAAFGTETVPKCHKIVGPGSPWVVAAKRSLSHIIDPGIPAGPSESIVLADDSADGALAALDLIIESEHGPDSSAFLVTNSERVALEASKAVVVHWRDMDSARAVFSRGVLTGLHGGIVLVRDFQRAVDFVNAYAPEHLEVLVRDPMGVLGMIRNAGEVLLGPHTPITLGNYVLGTNAVLPTGGAAMTASPLSVFDYMKRIAVAWVTPHAYGPLASHAGRLAAYEGFSGHARAVSDLRAPFLARPSEDHK